MNLVWRRKQGKFIGRRIQPAHPQLHYAIRRRLTYGLNQAQRQSLGRINFEGDPFSRERNPIFQRKPVERLAKNRSQLRFRSCRSAAMPFFRY